MLRAATFLFVLTAVVCQVSGGTEGGIVFPYITGQPGEQLFAPHPGRLAVFPAGAAQGLPATVSADGRFQVPDAGWPASVIVGLDRLETLPLIMAFERPRGTLTGLDVDLAKHYDYVCLPPGYPEVWDASYTVRAHAFTQTFVARSRWLYSVTVFDGPKIIYWGNKAHVSILEGGFDGEPIRMPFGDEEGGTTDIQTAIHSDHEFPRVGFRHGDVELVPGRKYAVRFTGYQSHGGARFDLDTFLRPDEGQGYVPGQAYANRVMHNADICMIVAGNATGQIVENQIRSPEWDILIPRLEPTVDWGQTFVSHGVSMAGIQFWGSNGGIDPVTCEVRIRKSGPGGEPIGPAKITLATQPPPMEHPKMTAQETLEFLKTWSGGASSWQPIIRYPEGAGVIEGREAFYLPPYDQFQVSWLPDEVPLVPGETYYIELRAGAPLMLFADGDYYRGGYPYHNGQQIVDTPLFHSPRCTLAMTIMTYENPGGVPTTVAMEMPPPVTDGNLVRNPGAETGDFAGWQLISDAVVDPRTDLPTPPHRSGKHHFGMSIGWNQAEMGQYQTLAVVPGKRYVAGMWAAHADGTDERAQLLWCDGPFGSPEHLLAATTPEASTQWTLLEGPPFQPTGEQITLVIRYSHPFPTNIASIHVDDIFVREESAK